MGQDRSHQSSNHKIRRLGGGCLLLALGLLGACGDSGQVGPQIVGQTAAAPASPSEVGGDIPRSAWPESWFQGPKSASQVGLTTFHQSPALDSLVAAKRLPPVEERLPDDPIVVEPIDGIGTYGGTATLFQAGEQLLNVPEGPLRVGPQLQLNLPNFAAKAEYSDSARTLTITLRPGHKWSDGHPATADDFIFWFDHVQMNKYLTPVVEPRFKGARIEKLDTYRFAYHFPEPKPLFVKYLAHSGWRMSVPAHFMKRYHPTFTDSMQLVREAEEVGVQDWRTYYQAAYSTTDLMVFHRPVKTAYVIVTKTSTRTRLRRNPFYPKVDPAGNQLPYIDFIDAQRVDSPEIMTGLLQNAVSMH
ncbi:MAG: hypothetical protein GKR89_33495 [Candidatus Latescibacteria bacterium]|nr:hypothetical protein [Candidatus Latescibacterota bacterium]